MTTTVSSPVQVRDQEISRRFSWLGPSSTQALAITGVAVILFAVFSIFATNFFTLSNITSMAKVSSYTFIVGVGLTFLFIAAEIDLSIGANLSFAGIIMAICIVNYNINPWLAALVAILASALVGAVNGFIVTVFGVQSFIVTLGMLSVLGGAALVITDGVPITYPTNLRSSLFSITNGSFDGIPAPVLWAGVALVMGVFLLRFTRFGYHVYAVGGNTVAAREMGIRVKQTKMLCFILTGAMRLRSRPSSGVAARSRPQRGRGLHPADHRGDHRGRCGPLRRCREHLRDIDGYRHYRDAG